MAAMKAVKKAVEKKERSKDDKGLEEAKAATKMTKEQWAKHQVGAKEKWPQPAYMTDDHPEGKGHTCYRDETFEIVTRWHADTKISYRPHAKAPGTKSHVRYEIYSKVTTVGAALKKGSWPQDWCWDFERGYIKVSGPVRDEPIDISATMEDKDFTDVDRAVFQWYRKELARNLGLKIEDLMKGKGSQESTIMRAHRLVAQRESKKLLETVAKEKRKISDEEVLAVLQEWSFAKNSNRINVMQQHVSWVWSDTLGLLRDRMGDIHLTQATKGYPEFVQVLSQWLTERLPAEAKNFKFTSLNVNKDYAAKVHRDGNNFGPSMITAFGSFEGGELNYFPEDDGKQQDLENLHKEVDKVQFNIRDGLALFNGNCAHSVEDFKGNRFSVVYFTLGCHAKMKDEDRKALENMGVPTPALDEDPHVIIRPPLGRKRKHLPTPCREDRNSLPGSRFWTKEKLGSGAPKAKAASSVAEAKKTVTAAAKAKPAVKAASSKKAVKAPDQSETKKAAVKKTAVTKTAVTKTAVKAAVKKQGKKTTEKSSEAKDLEGSSIITRTDKPAKTTYIAERLKKVVGSTVERALASVTVKSPSGKDIKYRSTDLKYDIQCGYLCLKAA